MVRRGWRGTGRSWTVAALAGLVVLVVTAADRAPAGRAAGADGPTPDDADATAATAATADSDDSGEPRAFPSEGSRPGRSRPRRFTLVATGDVLLHSPLWQQAEADAAAAAQPGRDFRPLIASIRPLVEGADLAVCHLETPVAPPEGPFAGYPSFSVPPEVVPALADTGYDACTTASNHTYDQGAAGIDRTLADLDAAGIAHAGSARTPEEAGRITLADAGPAQVALLSYTFGFNGYTAPNGETWRSNPIDEARILADARRAREAGADVVVVALHWGNEYVHEPTPQQVDLAPRLIGSPDVDLLLGHHAHVVQPLEHVGGEWVAYGMGNLVATHSTPGAANHEGLLVRFTFTQEGGRDGGWRVSAAEYAPLLMVRDRTPTRLVDVARALADPATPPDLRARLELARDRTAGVVTSRGAAEAGLTPIAA